MIICEQCGARLSDDERHYYGGRCEDCERDAWEALQRWKAGEANTLLDRKFDSPRPTVH